ncbi:MAG: lysylphosphatidylglycerol synthase transmembrane domain-containing protein [Dehalococcoidia bacterium]
MRYLRLLLGFALSAVALFLAFRNVDFADVGDALRTAAYGWIVPAVALIAVSLLVRAVRWRLLFYPNTNLHFGNVFGSMNAGYLVNTVLPARLGEVVRAVLLSRLEKVRVAHAVSTVVVERVLDLLTNIVILGLLIPFVALPSDSVLPLLIATALAVIALVVMIAAGARPELTHRLVRIASARLPQKWAERLHHTLDSVLEGFRVLSNGGVALRLALLSLVIWLLVAAAMECMLLAFHLDLPLTAPMFVLALVQLSFILPSTPGHIGVFQFAAVEALAIGFNVDRNAALSFALVTNLVSFAPPALLGLWFIWRSGSSLGGLVTAGRQAQAEIEAEPVDEAAATPSPDPSPAAR